MTSTLFLKSKHIDLDHEKKPNLIPVDKDLFDKVVEEAKLIKQENQQLMELNRRIIKDLEMYMQKDNLKEASYIIQGLYNQQFLPLRYKFLLQDKKEYLKAIDFNIEHIKTDVIGLYESRMNELRLQLLKEKAYQETIKKQRDEMESMNKQFQVLQQKFAGIKRENDSMTSIIKKITEKSNQLKQVINFYKQKYYDIDISELHKKITLVSTECNNLKVVNKKLNFNLARVKDNHLNLKKKISQVTGFVLEEQDREQAAQLLDEKNNFIKKILEEDEIISESEDENNGQFFNIGQQRNAFDPLIREEYEEKLKKNDDLVAKF
ncbi:UNKNOWN [Stylonychia lemnae]|uniref:Uncharacterized protein n=1 Tax=Stylonychia lemnae TaxID=5949 RepID=A0A078B9K3_STYLE|nr:UNKNOWN [Stylonychia lemnae]|eukprot:CDW89927.1 UNKNOWN [Stylonychia lemnae]